MQIWNENSGGNVQILGILHDSDCKEIAVAN